MSLPLLVRSLRTGEYVSLAFDPEEARDELGRWTATANSIEAQDASEKAGRPPSHVQEAVNAAYNDQNSKASRAHTRAAEYHAHMMRSTENTPKARLHFKAMLAHKKAALGHKQIANQDGFDV